MSPLCLSLALSLFLSIFQTHARTRARAYKTFFYILAGVLSVEKIIDFHFNEQANPSLLSCSKSVFARLQLRGDKQS